MIKEGCKVRFEKDETDKYGNKHKKYNYLTDMKYLKPNDLIVVHARDTFELAYFVEYCEIKETPTTKWIVQKVHLEEHNKRIANIKRIEQIKENLEEERKKAEEIQIYEILAERNPAMKELLQELKELKG